MGIDPDMTAEDIRLFLDEAQEQLQVMEAGILRLEQEGENPEQLHEVFRAAHTLKGSSATLGHRKMAELTHAMENVLDRLRKEKLTLRADVVDTLFGCLDVLVAFKEEIAAGTETDVTIDAIVTRLGTLEESEAIPRGSCSPSGAVPCRIIIAIDPRASMPAVRAFQAVLILGELGKVQSSDPSQLEIESDQVAQNLTVDLVTEQSPDRIRAALAEIPEIKVSRILTGSSDVTQKPSVLDQTAAAAVMPAEPLESGACRDEPRTPVTMRSGRTAARTVRVDVNLLDNLMNLVGELVIDRTRLVQVLNRLEVERTGDEMTHTMSSALAHFGRMTSDLQAEIQRARMLPLDNLFRKIPRMVRDLAHKAGKSIELVVIGEETELDRSVIEEISDPLMHLLRNAVDHGVESPAERKKLGKPPGGKVMLEAMHEENQILISIRDDGRGMDPDRIRAAAVRKGICTEETTRRMSDLEAIHLVWEPGFSTVEQVSDLSGRGVGLDVVHKNIERLNGSVEIHSVVGSSTEFRIRLPLTLAIMRALRVRVGESIYCMPLGSVVETDRIELDEIRTVRRRKVILKRGEVIPLIYLTDALGLSCPVHDPQRAAIFVVIVAVRGQQIALAVDELIGEGDVVVKPLGQFIGDVPGVSGATILGDGDVAIILDIPGLIKVARSEADLTDAPRAP